VTGSAAAAAARATRRRRGAGSARTPRRTPSSRVAGVAPSRRRIAAIEVSGLTTTEPSSRCSTTTYSPERSPLTVTWVARCVLIRTLLHAPGAARDGSAMEALTAAIASALVVTPSRNPRHFGRNLHPTRIHQPLPRPYKHGVTGSRPVPPMRPNACSGGLLRPRAGRARGQPRADGSAVEAFVAHRRPCSRSIGADESVGPIVNAVVRHPPASECASRPAHQPGRSRRRLPRQTSNLAR